MRVRKTNKTRAADNDRKTMRKGEGVNTVTNYSYRCYATDTPLLLNYPYSFNPNTIAKCVRHRFRVLCPEKRGSSSKGKK